MATRSSNNSGSADNQAYTHRCLNLIFNIGGRVYKHILQNELDYRSLTLKEFLEANREEIRSTISNTHQYKMLFPVGVTAVETFEKFDITLIGYLLQHFFIKMDNPLLVGRYRTGREAQTFKIINSREVNAWHWSLKGKMFPWNTNIVADIARIREYRNLIHEIVDTKTWLSKAEFETTWSDFSAVLLNLARAFGIPNMFFEIEKVLHEPLDAQRQDQLMKSLDELKNQQTLMSTAQANQADKVNQNVTEVVEELKKTHKSQTDAMQTQERTLKEAMKEIISENDPQNNLKECSERYMNSRQVYLSDKVFVKTQAYRKASKCLAEKRTCILRGNKGEGKTTVALKLIREQSKKGYRILKTPDDWRYVDSKTCDVVFIEDIYGDAKLDKQQVKKWRSYLEEIQHAVMEKDVRVIITIKPHILKQAKVKLTTKACGLFDDENVVTITSNDLLDNERNDFLVNHLNVNNRVIDTDCLRSCATNYKERPKTMFHIGFPQCVNMYATVPKLFDQGVSFFKQPIDYIRQCLIDIFEDKTTYSAFYHLWLQPNQAVRMTELEKEDENSTTLLQKCFISSPNDFKTTLLHHEDGFINYCEDNEEFSFSHAVIADVVGLIICDKDINNGIKLCPSDFIVNYVTTEATECSHKVCIKEARFEQLFDRLISIYRLKTCTDSVLGHNAFQNEKFLSKLGKRRENEFVEVFYGACCKGNIDLVSRLLNYGLEYKVYMENGLSPIQSAAFFGHHDIVAKLVENDPEQLQLKISETGNKMYKGATLLHIAVLKNSIPLAKRLTQLGADRKIQDSEGNTPLLLSLKADKHKLSRILLDRVGVEVDIPDNYSNTPLMMATSNGQTDIVKSLTNKVKNLNCKNMNNQTALDIAVLKEYKPMKKLLKKKGAKTATELDA